MATPFQRLTNVLLTLISLAYPIGWLLFPSHQQLRYLVIALALLWAIKAWQAVGWQRYFALLMASLISLVYITQTLSTMYWYPVLINGAMLVLFGSSLWGKQSMVERFARLKTSDLPPKGIRYTRKVTKIWCLFFLFNIILCSLFIYLDAYQWWALYTGIIAYLLMGLLIGGEWIVRQHVMKIDRPEPQN